MNCRCRDHRGLGIFVRGSDVEVCQIFFNVLQFGFSNILLLLRVATVTNSSVFLLINCLSDS